MPGDIFYSEVDQNLQSELQARGVAPFNRRTADLNYMLEKVANVSLVAYDGDDRRKLDASSYLGPVIPSTDVDTGESISFPRASFLPSGKSGYLNENSEFRQKNITTGVDLGGFQIEQNDGNISVTGEAVTSSIEVRNIAQRVPPFITACSIQIADSSTSKLNKAEVQISIPNADLDLETIERIYFRPGRLVQLRIVHPESAVRTGNRLTDDSILPSFEALKKQNPEFKLESLNKLNVCHFEAVITSFQFSYEQDLSISATLFLTGISSTFADLSMLITTPDFVTGSLGSSYVDGDENKVSVEKKGDNLSERTTNSFYEKIADEINSIGDSNLKPGNVNFAKATNKDPNTSDQYVAIGSEFKQGTDFIRYVSVGYLIDFINREIISKNKTVKDAKIICNSECRSNVYDNLTSANPRDILIPGQKYQKYPQVEVELISGNTQQPKTIKPKIFAKKLSENTNLKPFLEKGSTDADSFSYPSRILISETAIKDILTRLDPIEVRKKDSKVAANSGVQIKDFLRELSNKIAFETGGAIDMKLIVHPNDSATQTTLMYYDSNFAGTPSSQNGVVPFQVPMFANNEFGTVVREFSMKAKLPDNAKTLAFVLSSEADVSEAKIAPFLQFMYQDETQSASEQIRKLKQNYAQKHVTFKKELNEAIAKLSQDHSDDTYQQALRAALKKHLQYPKIDIGDSSVLGSPQFPYEVDITIDGINGFRYGDVLQFPGIPKRYIRNTVFFITNIAHTVDTSGLWVTKITAQMRAKID